MEKTKLVFLILILAICIASLTACSRAEQYFVYGTTLTIKADDLKSQKDMQSVADYIASLEGVLSATIDGSDVAKINAAKAGEAVKCSAVTMQIAKIAKAVYEFSNGAYDPSVYPLVRLWKFSGDTFGRIGQEITPPTDEEINETLKLVGFDKFVLDFENSTVTKTVDGAMLDFGGIAKGYAVNESLLKTDGKMLVNLGGNIGARNKSYKIGIANPTRVDRNFSTAYYAKFTLEDGECVSTSGDYERYYTAMKDGKTVYYSHIIDPKTGYPVATAADGAVISCTVITKNVSVEVNVVKANGECKKITLQIDGTTGDALATAVIVLGKEKGVQLLESLGICGLIITSDLQSVKVGDFDVEIQ